MVKIINKMSKPQTGNEALHPPQIKAGDEIVAGFKDSSYVMLLAEMQSGKTGTFMYVACEMLRNKQVNKCVIFSGNRETDLKEQTKNQQHKFYIAYSEIMDKLGIKLETKFCMSLKENIEVVWGSELKNYIPTHDKTLYIWEESHYGQSQKQEVDKFLTRLGIQATGKTPEGILLLSVSATPFSEFIDNASLNQQKFIVRLETDETYLSVAKMKQNGQVKVYDSQKVDEIFLENLGKYSKYGIVRASESVQSRLSVIAQQEGWAIINYDLTFTETMVSGLPCKSLNDILSTSPETNTIIFLKGMLRMGKQLKKTNISFCMETSTSKADTRLQGLLGRCAGYDSRTTIYIYLPEKQTFTKKLVKVSYNKKDGSMGTKYITIRVKVPFNITFREIDLFDGLHKGEGTVPTTGSNLKTKVHKTREPIIPLRITLADDPEDNEAQEILEAFEEGDVTSYNSAEITEQMKLIAFRILSNHLSEEYKEHFKVHRKGVGFEVAIKKLERAFQNKIPLCKLGSGLGAAANADEIVVFVTNKYLYITSQLPTKNYCLPETTGKEVFCRETIPELTFAGNLKFKIKTTCATDPDVLYTTLNMCSDMARQYGTHFESTPTKITYNGFEGYKGITLTPQVFEALQGTISARLLAKGVRISWKKAAGRPVSNVRLTEISWSFK